MGTYQHHAIVMVAFDDVAAATIQTWFNMTCPAGTEVRLIRGPVTWNDHVTLVLVPDGSKEGASESNKWDLVRDKLVIFLQQTRCASWIETTFGELGPKIVRSSSDVLKTGLEWAKEKGYQILDPDGWRKGDGIVLGSLITEEDFKLRVGISTCRTTVKAHDAIVKTWEDTP